ncbi:MAG: MFS transporter, partial [Microbacteriaceae bacterium]
MASPDTVITQDSPDSGLAKDSAAAPKSTGDSRRWWALGIIALAQLMVVLDASIITIALPYAQVDLDISDANRQWALTAYTLMFGGL